MISTVDDSSTDLRDHTVWGLDPVHLHDRFWAARGVQVVRQGEPSEIVRHAELYLLIDSDCLSLFRLGQLVDTLSWLKPQVLFVRIHDTHAPGYRERVLTDGDDSFTGFERAYRQIDYRLGRVALTPHEDVARAWQTAREPRNAWRDLRRSIPAHQRSTISVDGCVFDRSNNEQVMGFVRELITVWKRPDATIKRASKLKTDAWGDRNTAGSDTRFVGPVWVGVGRELDGIDSIVGPAVLWDDPDHRPEVDSLEWHAIEPSEHYTGPEVGRRRRSLFRISKRIFDVVFALAALACTLPLYPFIMLAIMIEDGRPWFFAHPRESVGGKEFPCLKFRTMYNNAEEIKQKLAKQNQADGPQFFIENDPRITKVGNFMRKFNIDELPQFFNVLIGQMSVVGPRPSPYKENQFSPSWREARLSTRPGVTGLWQVKRSREPGKDFQEWIRYDIRYVETMCWKLDLYIMLQTVLVCAGLTHKPDKANTEHAEQADADPAVAAAAPAESKDIPA
ncbi:MAG: sugar transferase [Phycisphaerales bacterium JB063]